MAVALTTSQFGGGSILVFNKYENTVIKAMNTKSNSGGILLNNMNGDANLNIGANRGGGVIMGFKNKQLIYALSPGKDTTTGHLQIQGEGKRKISASGESLIIYNSSNNPAAGIVADGSGEGVVFPSN